MCALFRFVIIHSHFCLILNMLEDKNGVCDIKGEQRRWHYYKMV